ncbi:MAG: hypothetical protein AB7O96_16485 [Pseudobdellovibrionaceae bacterium]
MKKSLLCTAILRAPIAAILFLAACASTPPAPEPEPIDVDTKEYGTVPARPQEKVVIRKKPGTYERPANVDLVALQRSLRLERAPHKLGLVEKTFDTCKAGYGYSSNQDCHTETFVLVHFRMMCRDSIGTISTVLTDADLTAIRNRALKWDIQGTDRGEIVTDNDGYGQIRTTSIGTAKAKRLKITTENDFLYLKAGEIKRVVAPGNWCN